MNVLVEEGRITKVQGLKDHPLNKGRLCPKGARAIELVYHPDRLKYPFLTSPLAKGRDKDRTHRNAGRNKKIKAFQREELAEKGAVDIYLTVDFTTSLELNPAP